MVKGASSVPAGWSVGLDHGIDFTNKYFLAWFIGVPVAYLLLAGTFRALGWWNFKLQVMKKKKLQDSTTRASDDMAFELVAGFCVTYLAAAGFIGSYSLFGVDDFPKLMSNEFYGDSEFVRNHLIYPMINYQGWNVVLCLTLEVLGDPNMIGHHIVTGSLAYLGLHPYLHLRGLYFLGIAEVTNIPLTVYDVCKKFDRLGWKSTGIYELSQATFAISFIIFRLILWPYYCIPFWMGSVELLTSGRAHSPFVVVYFLLSNVFLTGLQVFWGQQIVVGLLQVLGIMKKPIKSSASPPKKD